MRGEEESYNVKQSAERLDLQKNYFESGSIVARISRGISSLDFEKNRVAPSMVKMAKNACAI
jgi:hypothetical protein